MMKYAAYTRYNVVLSFALEHIFVCLLEIHYKQYMHMLQLQRKRVTLFREKQRFRQRIRRGKWRFRQEMLLCYRRGGPGDGEFWKLYARFIS